VVEGEGVDERQKETDRSVCTQMRRVKSAWRANLSGGQPLRRFSGAVAGCRPRATPKKGVNRNGIIYTHARARHRLPRLAQR
jgi:hypothetical protein